MSGRITPAIHIPITRTADLVRQTPQVLRREELSKVSPQLHTSFVSPVTRTSTETPTTSLNLFSSGPVNRQMHGSDAHCLRPKATSFCQILAENPRALTEPTQGHVELHHATRELITTIWCNHMKISLPISLNKSLLNIAVVQHPITL